MFSPAVFRLGAATAIAYPLESVALILRFSIKILGLAIFWYLILQGSTKQLDVRNLISYFLISMPIGDITMSANSLLGRAIRKAVKDGSISQIMIKPISIITYYYSYVTGEQIVRNLLLLVSLVAGILLVPPTSFLNLIQFVLLLITSMCLGFAINMFEATLSLLFTEVSGIKNSMMHVIRLLSGALIPLSLFPDALRNIVELTPFPSLIFGPIAALNFPDADFSFAKYFIVSTVWSVLLVFGVLRFWKYALSKYEVFGL